MSYIGNEPTSVAFLTDTFSGNGSTTAFTMSAAPATTTSILVAITGVVQDPSTYSVIGTTLTFSAAPPTGTGNISVRYLGIPASGVVTTAYRTLTEFTATAGQTTFTPPSYTPGYINVYRNGVMLGAADYTASNGTTIVLATGALVGDLITTESFYVSSVLNALPQTGGTIGGSLVVNGATGQNPLIVQTNSTERMRVDSSGNVGIGTSSPSGLLHINGGTYDSLTISGNTSNSIAARFQNAFSGSKNWNIGVSGGGPSPNGSFFIYDDTTASTRLVIDSSGYVTNAVNGLGNGILQAQQYYRLNSGLAGANVNTAQSIFGVGVTLVGSTVYEFEILAVLQKTAGTTAHTVSVGFGGTATINNIFFESMSGQVGVVTIPATDQAPWLTFSNTASSVLVSSSQTAANMTRHLIIKGTVSVNAGGTFIPQYTLSAAPGGAYTTQAGSYIKIAPLSASGSNTSIGTWA